MSETEAPKPAPQPQWQIIQGEPVSAYYLRTARLPVPGGWLYRVEAPGDPPTMCFVPAPPRGQGLP